MQSNRTGAIICSPLIAIWSGSLLCSLGILDDVLFSPMFLQKGVLEVKPKSLLWVSGSFPDPKLNDPYVIRLFIPTPSNYFLLFFLDILHTDHMSGWSNAGLPPSLSPIEETIWTASHFMWIPACPHFGYSSMFPRYANLLTRCTFLQVCSNSILLNSKGMKYKGIY